MNIRESADVESAYGSEISLNSGLLIKKKTITKEEPTLKNQTCYQWLKHKLREYMVLEAVSFLILVALIIICYRINSPNQETLTLQSPFNSFQKQTTGKDVVDSNKGTKEVIENENEPKTTATRRVDHSELPALKAWCTYEKEPVLTINLAKCVKPIAVSYQHSKWNGVIPDDAPKVYDVVACHDSYCKTWSPLISNCEYNSNGDQKQVCHISSDSIGSPVGKLQFRFRKNHGNTERTCVFLVRVHAKTEEVPEQNLKSMEDTKTCLYLKHDFYNNPRNYFDFKDCTVLFTKGCCTECPECCEECIIQGFDIKVVILALLIIIAAPMCALLALTLICGLLYLILRELCPLFRKIFLYVKRLFFP